VKVKDQGLETLGSSERRRVLRRNLSIFFGFVRVTTYAATQISHVQRVSPTCQFLLKLQARENAVISVFYSLFASERCP
jgi:hypothetical protein